MHKAAHICSRLFVQTGELSQELFTPPQFVAFFCNKPPHFALWVKGLFHTHPPHHTIVNHRISIPNSPCRGHPTGSGIAGKEHLSQTGLYQLLWGLSEHTPEHSAAANARLGRGIPPSGSRPRLLHREVAASRAGIHSGAFAPGQPRFAASRPGIIFPSAHKPRPHLESCISGPGTCAGCNYFCRFPSKSRQTAAFFV